MKTLLKEESAGRVLKAACKRRLFGFALLTALSIPAAWAGCGDPSSYNGPFGFPDYKSDASAYQREALAAASNQGQQGANASIVGMWKFQVVANGNSTHTPPIPDGAPIDSGYSQWHSDGTEFSISAGHSPASGNICMGAWVNMAPRVFQLNHFALNYDPSTGAWVGTVNIHQTVTVSAGGTMYTGSYIIDVYDAKGNHSDHIVGQVTGTRITLDSTVN